MAARTSHRLGVAPLGLVGAAVLAGQSIFPSEVETASPVVLLGSEAPLPGVANIMGGSGTPLPDASMTAAAYKYLDPHGFAAYTANSLFTPEGFSGVETPVKSLPVDTSIAQGRQILDSTVESQVAAGQHVVVLGYSQSATIASLAMTDLANAGIPKDYLSFVLLGDPSNPNGGLLERFGDPSLPYLTVPSLGVTFTGATPVDTDYSTNIYTGEYDGFADFPRYPINFLSDLNAMFGILYVHLEYADLTPEQIAAAQLLPGSAELTGEGATNYWMIPTQTLPLLAPLLAIPVIGKPIYDPLEPDMRVLVNLGYGSITDGWDSGPANVATPVGLWPTNVNPTDIFQALGTEAETGIRNFVNDLQNLNLPDLSSMLTADSLPGLDATSPDDVLTMLTNVVNDLSGGASSLYSTLLSTADIINAELTSLPMYCVNLFSQYLAQGDLLDAIGMPVAAAVGLGTVLAASEVLSLLTATGQF